ncbi:nitrate reductase associated protein [Dyadobacter sandarakinus]|uniref:Nitrate reductase associated protein n=1 Tax=Dyadobacter sandarakinus TaxID=2747268 RepID=A0ABX7I478_9BACT|nr:nitrate reductase associated protein [Dyadobacter sandarakinus]QRR00580.1 nitrate reductase associated protein [Dyadobacter sandarakinus]
MIAADLAPRYFEFEQEFAASLRCIPMIVRYKLDACRVKMQLADWVKCSFAQKEQLACMPCSDPDDVLVYKNYLTNLIEKQSGYAPKMLAHIADSWNDLSQVPAEVAEKAADWACPVPHLHQWQYLDVLERFALVKLSRSGHEGKNFPAACREFGLLPVGAAH